MNFEIVKRNSLKNRQFLGCFLIQPQKSATFNKNRQKSATRTVIIPRAGVGIPPHRGGEYGCFSNPTLAAGSARQCETLVEPGAGIPPLWGGGPAGWRG